MQTIKNRMADLTDGYNVVDGVIRSFGKFEAEPVEILYWYDAMMNGDGEFDDDATTLEVQQEEREAFNLKPDVTKAVLIESDYGFVYLTYA